MKAEEDGGAAQVERVLERPQLRRKVGHRRSRLDDPEHRHVYQAVQQRPHRAEEEFRRGPRQERDVLVPIFCLGDDGRAEDAPRVVRQDVEGPFRGRTQCRCRCASAGHGADCPFLRGKGGQFQELGLQ